MRPYASFSQRLGPFRGINVSQAHKICAHWTVGRELTSGFAGVAAPPGLWEGLPPKKLRISEGMIQYSRWFGFLGDIKGAGWSNCGLVTTLRGSNCESASDALGDVFR